MRFRLPAFIALLTFIAGTVSAGGNGETRLMVYYTSSLNGNLDGCTCKAAPKAGLVKRAAYLRGIGDRSNGLLVDLGDVFPTDRDELLCEAILETYAELGYDAFAVGDQETSEGMEELLSYRDRFPLLSNNLSICIGDACRLLSPTPLTFRKSGLSVGVAALIDPEVFALYPGDLKAALKIAPCAETAQAMLGHLRGEGTDVRILLYHGPLDKAMELAAQVPGFDVVLAGHEQLLRDAVRVGKTIVASPGEEGNRLGILELRVDGQGVAGFRNTFRLFDYLKDPDDLPTRGRIDGYYRTMRARLKKD